MPTELLTKETAPSPAIAAPSPATSHSGRAAIFSFTVQLVGLLAATYLALWCFYPWRPLAELDIPAWMVKFAATEAATVCDTRAEVVVIGTSLVGAPPARLKRPQLYRELLSQAAGKNLTVDTITAPGAVMSDQSFIVDELFKYGKHPALVVLTYSTREFIDNEVGDRIAITPTRRVVTFINRRQSFMPSSLSWNAISDCFSNHVLFGDLLRRHWLKEISAATCKITHHPLTLWDGARMPKAATETGNAAGADSSPAPPITVDNEANLGDPAVLAERLKNDIADYSHRYNPYNEKRTSTQLQYLDNLLSACKSRGTAVMMLGMPVSDNNKKLLAPGVLEGVNERITATAARYGASIVDINATHPGEFSQSDFIDTVHVSASGALRFAPLFTDAVLSSAAYKHAFSTKSK